MKKIGDVVTWTNHAGEFHRGTVLEVMDSCCDSACEGHLCVVKVTESPLKRHLEALGMGHLPGIDEADVCDTVFDP